jgi:DNA-binding NtrC family response regulator
MSAAAPTLLVVDDEPYVLQTVTEIASQAGFHVVTAASGGAGIRASRENRADLAMVDLKMPDVGGLDVLRAIHDSDPRCQMILMTGHASVETAVEAIKIGAMDYLSKPLDVRRVEQLLSTVREEVEKRQRIEIEHLARQRECFGMVGTGAAMQHLFGAIRRLAPFIRTALISGETGTGKELVARALHKAGRRSEKRFVTINCSAVVETLFESELFGHVRGAFTGATETKPGLFEVADGGVLFLDEVGELPLAAQVRLLRVVQDSEVVRVGGERPIRVHVRIVAATHRDLPAMVETQAFREDLYYRLAVFPIVIPPLRDRPSDIRAFAEYFAERAANRFGIRPVSLSDDDVKVLSEYRWPGNVREMAAVMDRAVLVGQGRVLDIAAALGQRAPGPAAPARTPTTNRSNVPFESLDSVVTRHIQSALDATRGRIEGPHGAARLLRINPHTLRARMRKLRIDWKSYRRADETD